MGSHELERRYREIQAELKRDLGLPPDAPDIEGELIDPEPTEAGQRAWDLVRRSRAEECG